MMKNKIISLLITCALIFASVVSVYAATPVAVSFSTAVPVNAQSMIQLQGSDADGTPLVFATTTSPAHGALSNLNTATGAVIYTPTAGYTGSDSFNYTVTSGGETSNTATVTLTVTAGKTRIIDTVTNLDGTPRVGKVSFFLSQISSSPSGVIPAKSSVSATLNSSGQFDVSVYPSRAINPVQFYQVYFDDARTGNSQMLGIYDIPASTASISLSGHLITNANLAAQYTFASKAEVDALTQAVAAATTAQLYPSLTSGKHIVWNGSTFANSLISESGSTVTVTGSQAITSGQTVAGGQTVGLNQTVGGDSAITGSQTIGVGQAVTGGQTVGANQTVGGNQTINGNQTVVGTSTASGYNGIQPANIPPLDTAGFRGTLPNARTTATTSDTPNSIVQRDSAGHIVGNGAGLTGVVAAGTGGGNVSTGSLTNRADSGSAGVGMIDDQIGTTTFRRLNNDGTTDLIGGLARSTRSALPTPCKDGRRMVVTDDIRGEWRCTNNLWVSVTGYANVKDFGATGDGSTDDTAAIQAAINIFDTLNRDGTVYFPKGVYVIAGALQDTSNSNAQIVLPKRTSQLAIRLLGETPIMPGTETASTAGTVLKSTLSSGTGNVIGVKNPAGYLNLRTTLWLTLENLTIRTVANPTNSAVNLENVQVADFKNVKVDTGETYNAVTQPTTTSSYGVKVPGNNVGAGGNVDNLSVSGFRTCFQWNELTNVISELAVTNCYNAIEVTANFHADYGNRVIAINNKNGLVFTGGASYLTLNQYDIEHNATNTNWFYIASDISDSSNYGHGLIRWHVVAQNIGVGHTVNTGAAVYTSFNLSGGSNLNLQDLSTPGQSPPVFDSTGAAQTNTHMVRDGVQLLSGNSTVTLTGSAVFTSLSSYSCSAIDKTAANAVKIVKSSGTSFTLSGTGSDVIEFICVGY
jgi:hypothetical protein